MRRAITHFLFTVASSVPAFAQMPLDVKPGLWELTTHNVNTGMATLPPGLEKTLKAQMTPAQYANYLASLEKARAEAAKGVSQTKQTCFTPANLQNPNLLGQNVKYERVDPEHFHASMDTNVGGSVVVKTTFTAKWLAGTCPTAAEQVQARGIAAKANSTVMSFVPYNSSGRLGRFFAYTWTGAEVTLGYIGGIAGAPKPEWQHTYFHGTDGAFLYVTLVEGGGPCGSKSYKLDKSGAPAPLTEIPLGLKGGLDEIRGGPPCRAVH